jgi:peptidyl-prolyl cis-trans isomerase SurA
MVRYICSLYILLSIAAGSWAQENEPLISIGNTTVPLGEFERIYKKNNSNLFDETDKKTPAEYLELYINFKLKVIEAQNLKMDSSEVFINELAGYRTELAAPYLTDVNFEEKMVEEIYNRMIREVDASHILIMAGNEASPDQEQAALNKIIKIRNEILAGKNFNEAAVEYSEDPSAQTNKGNLGYFSAFQMVAPFEDAAFSTPVGSVSEPVRTTYGYHLVKVHDIRPNQGEIKVAHIMKMFPQGGASESAKMKLKAELDSIFILLKQGADFAELAKKHSDDKNSGSIGGEMPTFSSGRMIPEFSNPAFSLKNIGDFTQPVETPYGYHIIKKLEQKPTPTFSEVKNDIETRLKRDPERSTSSKKVFTDKLKTEYGYSEIHENTGLLKNLKIGNPATNPEMVLFKLDGKEYHFSQLNVFVAENNIGNSTYSDFFEAWVEDEITTYEDSKLEEKYPDFKYLMQEYHDGILLFNISEEKIWNFAALDTTGLMKFSTTKTRINTIGKNVLKDTLQLPTVLKLKSRLKNTLLRG